MNDPMAQPIRNVLYPPTARRVVALARRLTGRTKRARRGRRSSGGAALAGLVLGVWLGLTPAHADPGAPHTTPAPAPVSSAASCEEPTP